MAALPYPFLTETFLQALEESNSASTETGWHPIHLKYDEDFMPLYLKDHSMGEYVFDHAWANAYHQHGLDYYPKLVTAIPFTPSTGYRVRGTQPLSKEQATEMIDEVIAIAEETDASSWHLLFPSEDQMASFKDSRLLTRLGVQYHWHNENYQSFDDYLSTMTSRKRKMIKKERADIVRQNIDINVLPGDQVDGQTWALFYHLYERTYAKRNGTRGYLTRNFFEQIAKQMPEQIAMAVAYIDGDVIACALYFFDDQTLYGRYWGSIGEFPFLHFELCYYQGIEFAIRKGLTLYDAGAQGEHKLVRGFRPVMTHSMHWIRNLQFREAIEQFVTQEARAIEQHIAQATKMLPFKN